ncbi:polysaccharide deacetylase family protein [Sinomonas sp. B1-1]|uniref:polysaccharide deacetylase family protein n=1 Tax=Sinomonas sp. B1-1 TaxID=3141454 RepID=UPI003D2E8453
MAVLAGRRLALVIGAALVLVLVAAAVAIAVVRNGFLGQSPTAQPSASATASASLTPSPSQSTTAPIASGEPTATPSDSGTPVPEPPPSDVPAPAPPQPGSPIPSPAPAPPPATALPPGLRGIDVERFITSQRVVALTFDAGGNDAGLASILGTLAAQGVRATFFVTGTWAQANPAKVTQIAAAGHRIGNHSMTHPYFTQKTDAQIAAELAGAQQAILAAGAEPRPFFRFPYGDRNARTIAAVNANGYAGIRWTVDSLGWQGTMKGTRGPSFVVQRVMATAQPGQIVLMHVGSNPDDGSTLDADALPALIAQYRAAGYGFVTLDVLL